MGSEASVTCSSHFNSVTHHRPRFSRDDHNGMEPQKPWAKISTFFLSHLYQRFCLSEERAKVGYGKTVEIRHTEYPTCQHLEEVRPREKFLNGKETHTHILHSIKSTKGKVEPSPWHTVSDISLKVTTLQFLWYTSWNSQRRPKCVAFLTLTVLFNNFMNLDVSFPQHVRSWVG